MMEKKPTRKKTKILTLKSSQQIMERFASDSVDLRKKKNSKKITYMTLTELNGVWKQTKPERMLKQWQEAMKSRNAVLYPYQHNKTPFLAFVTYRAEKKFLQKLSSFLVSWDLRKGKTLFWAYELQEAVTGSKVIFASLIKVRST